MGTPSDSFFAAFAEIQPMRDALGVRRMVYQASAKESAAAILGLPLTVFYDLPYWEWREIDVAVHAVRLASYRHFEANREHAIYSALPCRPSFDQMFAAYVSLPEVAAKLRAIAEPFRAVDQ